MYTIQNNTPNQITSYKYFVIKEYHRVFLHRKMSELLNHIEEHPQDTRRLIGLDYTELQQLIQNAEKLHNEKQVLLENKKIRIKMGHKWLEH